MNALAAVFPGQRIYVPWRNPDAIERFRANFAPLIGHDAVTALLDELGCARIVIPTGRTPERRHGYVPVDVDRVVALTLDAQTAPAIARQLRCDPRSVH